METSYEIPNLINQGKHVGTRIKKTGIFHAQIGVKYHEYYIRWVNSETLNLMFKVDSLRKFHTAMWLEDMNPRKQSTVDREKKVLEIMRIFSEEADLEDPISLCNFCARFSLYDEAVSIFETPRHITIL